MVPHFNFIVSGSARFEYNFFFTPPTLSIHMDKDISFKNTRIRKHVKTYKTTPNPRIPLSCGRHNCMVPYLKSMRKNITDIIQNRSNSNN